MELDSGPRSRLLDRKEFENSVDPEVKVNNGRIKYKVILEHASPVAERTINKFNSAAVQRHLTRVRGMHKVEGQTNKNT